MINKNTSTRDVCHIFFPKPKRTSFRTNQVLSEKLLYIQNFIQWLEFKILTVFPYIGVTPNACLYHFNRERWRRKKAQFQSGFEPRYFNLWCDVEPAELLALPTSHFQTWIHSLDGLIEITHHFPILILSFPAQWLKCEYIPPLSHYTMALENVRKMKAEELLAVARCGAQGRAFDSWEGCLLFTSSIPQ